ncbi:hypothetical protein BaRGS_00015514 [Batillaria attramentaria]|uniref:Xanthine/uracil permease n=1 Tax=Batillaria attramentaria TaxID=370345 RepID=A0ABD0L1C8_9CAEN
MSETDGSTTPFLFDRDHSANMAGEAGGSGGWEAPVSQEGEVHIVGLENKAEEDAKQDPHKVIYTVEDLPPVYMWPVYGLQQTLLCVSGTLSVPFLISTYICAGQLPEVRAQLLNIAFFMCGVSTLLQTTVGVRLPIIQGASLTFLPVVHAMMQLDTWRCPDKESGEQIGGSLMVASLTQVLLGCTGMVGVLLRFIGPLTICPAIALIGLGFTSAVYNYAEKHWGAAMFTAALVLVFSLWLGRVRVPIPSWSRQRGCHISKFPVFVVVSVLLGVAFGWIFCFVLTEAGAFPSNSSEPAYYARTDINLGVIDQVPWFKIPYPFQFGMPTVSVAGFFGMFMAIVSSVLESIGDYYGTARVAEAPPPPPHAINRGIAIEGICSVISGMVGAGHATTSYSSSLAAISVTRVASRRVFQTTGVIMLVMGVLTKVGAIMTLIPEPVIGGLNAVLLGTLIAVGFSTLSYVDMTSSRNVTVVGVTFMLGLAVPQWINGNEMADQIITVCLGTPMFFGAVVGVILDNIVPGTPEERGIAMFQRTMAGDSSEKEVEKHSTYDLPFVSEWLRRHGCCSFVPFLPSFSGFLQNGKLKSVTDTQPGVSVVSFKSHSQDDVSITRRSKGKAPEDSMANGQQKVSSADQLVDGKMNTKPLNKC